MGFSRRRKTLHVAFRRGPREMEVDLSPIENPQQQWTPQELDDPIPFHEQIRQTWLDTTPD
jgi:hypothetical protein